MTLNGCRLFDGVKMSKVSDVECILVCLIICSLYQGNCTYSVQDIIL